VSMSVPYYMHRIASLSYELDLHQSAQLITV
jgi:hypothetical protein